MARFNCTTVPFRLWFMAVDTILFKQFCPKIGVPWVWWICRVLLNILALLGTQETVFGSLGPKCSIKSYADSQGQTDRDWEKFIPKHPDIFHLSFN